MGNYPVTHLCLMFTIAVVVLVIIIAMYRLQPSAIPGHGDTLRRNMMMAMRLMGRRTIVHPIILNIPYGI